MFNSTKMVQYRAIIVIHYDVSNSFSCFLTSLGWIWSLAKLFDFYLVRFMFHLRASINFQVVGWFAPCTISSMNPPCHPSTELFVFGRSGRTAAEQFHRVWANNEALRPPLHAGLIRFNFFQSISRGLKWYSHHQWRMLIPSHYQRHWTRSIGQF